MKSFLSFLLTLNAALFALHGSQAQRIIHVPGDQPTIQAGINTSSNGDTVLVDPGIYNGYIDYQGKSITVASLYLMTSDTSYISRTMIEGNDYGEIAMVSAHSGEDSTTLLCGFTIRNHSGGGIYCQNSFLALDHVNVIDNKNLGHDDSRYAGGGIANRGSMRLKDVNIRGNHSNSSGGGIYNAGEMYLENVNITNNSSESRGGGICSGPFIQFDSINRCNIHSNFAWSAKDLYYEEPATVILDTFSVLYPTNYFVSPLQNFTFDILHGNIAQVSADLYVSPQGNDSASGLSADDPFKTITQAVSVILSDSLDPHYIYLSEGTYSNSSNGERFALNLPFYTSITGSGPDLVIMDAEEACIPLFYLVACKGSLISGLTVRNSSCGGIEIINSEIELDNMVIRDNINDESGTDIGGMACIDSKVHCNNVIIQNNVNVDPYLIATGGGIDCSGSILFMNNCSLLENESQWGCALNAYQSDIVLHNVVIAGNSGGSYGGISVDYSTLETRNALFTGNDFTAYYGHASNSRMINTTFSGNNLNSSSWESLILWSDTLTLQNCIIWEDQPYQVSIFGDEYDPCLLDISFSDIRSGLDGILIEEDQYGTINWLAGNISDDPLFLNSGDHPYELSEGSPCIDAGNPDTTGMDLPMWDLIGNYRLWDGNNDGDTVVDIGAYEFGSVGVGTDGPAVGGRRSAVTCFPNPTKGIVDFRFSMVDFRFVSLKIFDVHGREVAVVLEGRWYGDKVIRWDASGMPAGVYVYRLRAKGVGQGEAGKIVKY